MNKLLSRSDRALADDLTHGRCRDPFAVLGLHETSEGAQALRAWVPDARSAVAIIDNYRLTLNPVDGCNGLFTADLEQAPKSPYRLELQNDDHSWNVVDPYQFGTTLRADDQYLFNEGTHAGLHHWLGAQMLELEGVRGFRFAVWAPNAEAVSLVGDLNGWNPVAHPMRFHPASGVWELFVPHIEPAHHYKFDLLLADGRRVQKSDPIGAWQQNQQQTASLTLAALPEPAEYRGPAQSSQAPMSIYEVHPGSWRRSDDGSYLTYESLGDALIPYVLDMGFTHIQFMPIAEYPFDGSWGYQPTGLFAPTSRYGHPAEFQRLVDRCHEAGLGVLLDWVPAHFPSDEHGLARFDGTALFEHEDPRRGYHPDWNTLIYNFGRNEVRSFLLSSAMVWLERYGVDGLRVDAVASMLYLDYSREEGQWLPNAEGGRENLEAVGLLQMANTRLYQAFPRATMIAEESTAWPGVSRPVHDGGLGFGFKWNMGWMNDTLRYMSRDPVYRSHHHNELTFGLVYAFDENFILPLSHDEVVHGKRSILGRMPGDRWQQFANLRAYYGFMWTHPGKKLLFMGGEIAQREEWNHDSEVHWHLLAESEHRGVQHLVRDLNRLYTQEKALHQWDCDGRGFQWLKADDEQNSVVAFARRDSEGGLVVVVCNFTPQVHESYRIGVPQAGCFIEVLNTDAGIYGGSNVGNLGSVEAAPLPADGFEHSLALRLGPLATQVFRRADD